MSVLRMADSIVDRIVKVLVVISFTVLIAACVLQVFTRFVLNNSLSWTEELARYAFIWANLTGAAICVRSQSHATVTAITDNLPRKAQVVLKLFVYVIIMAISVILIRYGSQVAWAGRFQPSPALKVNMALINAAVPVSALCIFVHSLVLWLEYLLELIGKGEGPK